MFKQTIQLGICIVALAAGAAAQTTMTSSGATATTGNVPYVSASTGTSTTISPSPISVSGSNVGTSGAITAGTSITGPRINGNRIADNFPGADIGAQINAAVADCVADNIFCNISVNASGTISTPPVLPIGFSLTFNPQGTYTLTTNWQINHRSTSYFFDGANISCTLDNGTPCIYVGKNLSSVVDVSGTTLTWVSGSQFSSVDVGDGVAVWNGSSFATGNIAAVSATSITLIASLGTISNGTAIFFMGVSGNVGPYSGQGVQIYGLNISGTGSETNPADAGFAAEMTEGMYISGLVVRGMGNGACAQFLAALKSNIYGLHCDVDGSGLALEPNRIGGFTFSGANALRFFGVDLENSPYSSGTALAVNYSGGDLLQGLHVEGNANDTVAGINSSSDIDLQLVDWEQNTSTLDLSVAGSSFIHIHGPSQFQNSSGTSGLLVSGSTSVLIEQLYFSGQYATAFNSISGSTGKLEQVLNSTSGGFGTTGFIVENAAGSVSLPGSLTVGGGTSIGNSNALPQVGTPTAGYAACIKSAGPPVVIGYCSTAVSSSGACTCN